MTGLEGDIYSNSLGMQLTKIEAGEFYMGFEGNTLPDALVGRETHRQKGDFDEHPAHKVKISQSFHTYYRCRARHRHISLLLQ